MCSTIDQMFIPPKIYNYKIQISAGQNESARVRNYSGYITGSWIEKIISKLVFTE